MTHRRRYPAGLALILLFVATAMCGRADLGTARVPVPPVVEAARPIPAPAVTAPPASIASEPVSGALSAVPAVSSDSAVPPCASQAITTGSLPHDVGSEPAVASEADGLAAVTPYVENLHDIINNYINTARAGLGVLTAKPAETPVQPSEAPAPGPMEVPSDAEASAPGMVAAATVPISGAVRADPGAPPPPVPQRFKAWKSPAVARAYFASRVPAIDPEVFRRSASSTGRILLPPHHPRLPLTSPSTPKIPPASDPAVVPFSTAKKPAPAAPPTPGEIAVALQSQPGLAALPPSPFPDDRSGDGEEDGEERKLNISGTKTFEMKKADVKGDLSHFSTENYDSIPGFHLDQSMHLEIDGNVSRNAKVSAVLDDKEDEDRRFTINLDGPTWDLTMGDFPLGLADTEFQLFRKEVRGIMAQGKVTDRVQAMFLYSQSKGRSRREQFRGAGQQQEFRLAAQPVVQNSEKVTIDGRILTRGTDYLVDYEDGVVKFLAHILPIEVTSWIVIEYEVNDEKMAFKRNLYGTRLQAQLAEGRRIGLTWLRELDADTPKAGVGSSSVVPMQHDLVGLDADWRLSGTLSLSGETALSLYDPNRLSDTASSDRVIDDLASRFQLKAKNETLSGELGFRRVGKEFRMVGREGGVAELGERGLANDLLKGTGRVTWKARPDLQLFAGLESSKTNLSNDPAVSRIEFRDLNGGAAFTFRERSRLEARYGVQSDEERLAGPVTDMDKKVGTVVWDHELGPVFTQSKLEHTTYDDSLHDASGSRVLNLSTSIGSDRDRKLTWTAGAARVTVDDDIDRTQLRSDTRNYTLDLNYEPTRVLNARGILEWRTEDDLLVNTRQDGQIADSRIRYQPNRDWTSQFKYKVENTSKVIRDASLDPTRYVKPTSLPQTEDEKDDVLTRFENPVQKTTSNFTTSWHAGDKVETTFDWKRRDLKDRATRTLVSLNDRTSYEVRYTPIRQLKLTGEYEDGESMALSPQTKLFDTVRRFQIRNEFFEGYIIDTLWEDRDENDVWTDENDRRTIGKAVDFQRVFSPMATLEAGVQRNVIRSRQPSKEWETRAAFVLTPSARNQRYRLFLTNKEIDSAVPGTHREGGLSFSQFIGSDSLVEGEIKRVESTAGLLGAGYEGTVANAKMVITF
ncbi:MAG TPA: hypothetical protein PLP29_18700 [Candidatus Ozemobacteraceae bacterium]|nr:hypothetical protein [Candidatus Ozemobacteraceae bacterium]